MKHTSWKFVFLIAGWAAGAGLAAPGAEFATTDEGIVGTYRKTVPDVDFDTSKARDEKNKARVAQRQRELLEQRYDLADRPSGQQMGGGRRAVQEGVRVRLSAPLSWEQLGQMTPAEVLKQNAFPQGFRPLPHVKHETGGMVFPQFQIDEIDKQEHRSLQRFDVDFDLPDHLLPEFPPPIFLQMRPELGDVSQGKVLTTKNFFKLFNGIVTPVQMEGLRPVKRSFTAKAVASSVTVASRSSITRCTICNLNGFMLPKLSTGRTTGPGDRSRLSP